MLKVVFAGSPECAVPALRAIAAAHRVVAVLTNPPSRSGRSGSPSPTAVAAAAAQLISEGLLAADTPIIEPEKITDAVRAQIAAVQPDIMACFAYGKIFGPKTLALFPKGAINLHPSLLPRWRGCAPVPAAILAGDGETGISIQRMALEMDAGDLLYQESYPLSGTETADRLLDTLSRLGAPHMAEVLNDIEAGREKPVPQDSAQATYCSMLKKEDGRIDWTESAAAIDARIRAFSPWPGANTDAGGQTLIILEAEALEQAGRPDATPGTVLGIDKAAGILVQTGAGILALRRLQWRTKKPLDWKSFLNGSRDFTTLKLS